MLNISVVISTFGEESWKKLAEQAIESAEKAGAKEILYNHSSSLHEARNTGLYSANCEWVVHLDADDFLAPTFLEEISSGTSDIRVPAICYSYSNQFNIRTARIPSVWPHKHSCNPKCLESGNYIIVGAMVKTELAQQIGGWRDYPALEDFDLWQRCWLAGATFENSPKAIYLARVRNGSRNRIKRPVEMAKLQREISKVNFEEWSFKWGH